MEAAINVLGDIKVTHPLITLVERGALCASAGGAHGRKRWSTQRRRRAAGRRHLDIASRQHEDHRAVLEAPS